MDRDIIAYLQSWKEAPQRKPLLLRGARQVGKTYVIREFARRYFSHFVEINLELQPKLKSIFQDLNPSAIVKNLNLILNERIQAGNTLLFFDEIQESPQAIMSLRYFHEHLPELHVIGAGSLLEFVFGQKEFNIPVGRIEYAYLGPLSFIEFLQAHGLTELSQFIRGTMINSEIPPAVHQKLLSCVKNYFIVGGMPAVVQNYLSSPTQSQFQKEQRQILQTYRDDFGKYAVHTEHELLDRVFSSAPTLVGQRYKFVKVDQTARTRDLKFCLQLLEKAGVLNRVLATTGRLPLIQGINDRKFKIIYLDIGLVQSVSDLNAEILLTENLMSVYAGALAEQFVGQEILAQLSPDLERKLYFWAREKKNAQAEVDYLITHASQIIPVEVKSGQTGRLKSLRIFLDEFRSPLGLRISQLPLSHHDRILNIPLYLTSEIYRLLDHMSDII